MKMLQGSPQSPCSGLIRAPLWTHTALAGPQRFNAAVRCQSNYASKNSAGVSPAADQAAQSASSERQLLDADRAQWQRRSMLSGAAALAAVATLHGLSAKADVEADLSSTAEVDTTITAKVFLDIGIAERALKAPGERTIGDKSIIPEATPVGRITLGLYGNVAPGTVAIFLKLVNEGLLDKTIFARVLPGEYLVAGRQGSRRLGELETPKGLELPPNPDMLDPNAFKLRHTRPGTLSLNLVDNDEDPQVKSRLNYRPLEFVITTGPGPVPKLDGGNIVFGRVLEGFNVINMITSVPTFLPVGRVLAFNNFANAVGDERAEAVSRKYGRPLKAVVIQQAGVLPV